MKDKNPYNRRSEEVTKKDFAKQERAVKPVAKDTNKTRRPKMKAAEQVLTESPKKLKKPKSKGY